MIVLVVIGFLLEMLGKMIFEEFLWMEYECGEQGDVEDCLCLCWFQWELEQVLCDFQDECGDGCFGDVVEIVDYDDCYEWVDLVLVQ